MGEDFWALRRCMREPIPELFLAAERLAEAASFYCAGDDAGACSALKAADMPVLYYDWCESLWGSRGGLDEYRHSDVHRYRDVMKSEAIRSERIASSHIPAAVKRVVLARDGCFCRFCGVPVIVYEAQKRLREAYPETIRWGRDPEKHAAFQALDLDYDHIIPRSLGGLNEPDNLVVACAPCNCGRGNWTLDQVGVIRPRTDMEQAPRPIETWDGLQRVLACRS